MNDDYKNHPPQQTLLDRLIITIGELMSVIFLVVVAISLFEITMRYVFKAPTMWVHETATFIGGTLFIVGGAYAVATDKHVRVVLLYDYVSPKTRSYLNIFHHIMGILFFIMMAWASLEMVKGAWLAPVGTMRLETSGSAWNPPFPALLKGVIFITMVTLTLQFCLRLVAQLRAISRGEYV